MYISMTAKLLSICGVHMPAGERPLMSNFGFSNLPEGIDSQPKGIDSQRVDKLHYLSLIQLFQ